MLLRVGALVILSSLHYAGTIEPGSRYPPTKGEIWPKPQQEHKEVSYYNYNPSLFKMQVTNHNCTLLQKAVTRYSGILKSMHKLVKRHRRLVYKKRDSGSLCCNSKREISDRYLGSIQNMEVNLRELCEDLPYLEMDESYNLTVAEVSKLESASIWGIMRGLESFVQLFYYSADYTDLNINLTKIYDFPRYMHRGLLLDTSRHFLSLDTILATVDALAMNKMNVFHWHIIDDESFPYQSVKFPELSDLGAFYPTMIYSHADIKKVIEFARERGVRVLPEIDVPGHTRSWGPAFPDVLTECFSGNSVSGLGPMNPIRNITYKLIKELFKEVQALFPDEYFHIGGDEVNLDCWRSNHELIDYMAKNNLNVNQLHALFMRRALPLLSNKTKLVSWQDVYDENVPLPLDSLIHVWRYHWVTEMVNILQRGHKVLFSAEYYLDYLSKTFLELYKADPRQMVYKATGDDKLGRNIVGGEACMWGEMADDSNVLSRSWPRTSAVAEVLWSAFDEHNPDPKVPWQVYYRIEEHACRMIRRGIPAEPPVGPGFCVV